MPLRAAHRELRYKKPGVRDPSGTQPPRRTLDLRSSAPLLPPPTAFLLLLLWQTNVMWGAGNCHCHRRRLRLPRQPSLTLEEEDAFICRAARRPPGSRSAAHSARRVPAPGQPRRAPAPGAPRPHAREAAAGLLPGAGGWARGWVRGRGGRRLLCCAGVTEVKYMLTMGRPSSLGRASGRAGGLPPGLALSGAGWTSGWLPNDALPGRLLSQGPSALQ